MLFASRTCLIGAGIGLQGNPGRGISAGLQKRALQGTSLVVWKTLCFGGSHCQATPYRAGRGSLKGRGTLPLESSRLRGAGIGLRGDPGRGTNAGLQKRALQGTSVVVWKTLRFRGSQHWADIPERGEGKFEGEGGLSRTLPALQGKFGCSTQCLPGSLDRQAAQTDAPGSQKEHFLISSSAEPRPLKGALKQRFQYPMSRR